MTEAGNPHGDCRTAWLYADGLTDLQVLLVHGRLVDHHLVRARPFPVDERERGELGPGGVDAEAEVRCAAEVDDLAVDAEMRRPAGPAHCIPDVRQAADLPPQPPGR